MLGFLKLEYCAVKKYNKVFHFAQKLFKSAAMKHMQLHIYVYVCIYVLTMEHILSVGKF